MHLEEAFSLEFNRAINAERAHELFWANLIFDKRAFRCPGTGCSAQVTCANMDKVEMDMKQQPHFRVIEAHSADCELIAETTHASYDVVHGSSERATASATDEFVTTRPADHFIRVETAGEGRAGVEWKRTGGGIRALETSRCAQLFSVGSLVTRWKKARRLGWDRTRTVKVSGSPVTYAELFRCISPDHAEPLLQRERVYWGKAIIKKLKTDSYLLHFYATATHISQGSDRNSGAIRPSFFINESALKNYPLKVLLLSRLERAIDTDNKECIAFLYGTPALKVKEDSKGTGKVSYINFKLDNLDMLAILPLAQLEVL